jgi:hypothetical protein
MFPRSLRVQALVVLPAVTMAAAGLAGCGSSGGQVPGAGTVTAGTVAQHGPITAARLRGALLTKINGERAATPTSSGTYASLPEVRAERQSIRASDILPKSCAREALAGLETTALAGAPAAAVTFRVGRNGIAETLAAPTQNAALAVLSKPLPPGCGHYRARVGGRTYRYSVKERAVTGIGEQARVLNVRISVQPGSDIWSVMYRGPGFIGAITVVGPQASELAVRELGLQAYGFTAKSLS